MTSGEKGKHYFNSDKEHKKQNSEMVWQYWTKEGGKITEKYTALVTTRKLSRKWEMHITSIMEDRDLENG